MFYKQFDDALYIVRSDSTFLRILIVDCEWAEWEDWETCSVTCGDGTKSRTRTKAHEAQHGGTECPDSNSGSEACNLGPCPSKWISMPDINFVWSVMQNNSASCKLIIITFFSKLRLG